MVGVVWQMTRCNSWGRVRDPLEFAIWVSYTLQRCSLPVLILDGGRSKQSQCLQLLVDSKLLLEALRSELERSSLPRLLLANGLKHPRDRRAVGLSHHPHMNILREGGKESHPLLLIHVAPVDDTTNGSRVVLPTHLMFRPLLYGVACLHNGSESRGLMKGRSFRVLPLALEKISTPISADHW